MSTGAAVCGIGTAKPPRVVSNDEATAQLEVDSAWVERRTGIIGRHWAEPGARLHDLIVEAGRNALADAGVDAADLDLILVGTVSADSITPACAPLVAAELGAHRAGALDVSAACAGFVSCIGLAAGMIESGRATRVLAIGGEMMSRYINMDDRQTAAVFGDGAGAAVIEASDESRIGPVILGSDGEQGNLIIIERAEQQIIMDGHSVFIEAVRRMSEATSAVIEQAGLSFRDIDHFVFHQANARILTSITEKLGLDPDRVVHAIAHSGNTSAGSVPLALGQLRREGRLKDGDRVLLCAFGAGLVWGATIIDWGRHG
ncbi:unannotated protein [freshwater metagenome]|uniref:Unannotated protein n=1 Tax=freshwater metagenome TaxID=449393 RepID=A0A6J7HMK0_9ZZZZ|nr:beta-ketoacyl-ACP synthase III [Actinomycetota bacterium]